MYWWKKTNIEINDYLTLSLFKINLDLFLLNDILISETILPKINLNNIFLQNQTYSEI